MKVYMQDNLRIGIVCYPTYGGSGVIATELGIALANLGHQVHFISYDKPFRLDLLSAKIFYHEVTIPDYPLFEYTPYELNLTSKLVDVAINEKLDLLHVHYAIPHASAAVNAKKILETYGIDLPIVTTLHGTDITLLGKDKSFKPVIEYAINMSDVVTAVSESLRSETLEHFNVKNHIVTIPNFIDLSLYDIKTNNLLKSNYANIDDVLITHVSNFRKVKRVYDVIEIFEKVSKVISAKLLMVGDGPERLAAEQLCRAKGLTDKVKFLGKLRDVERVLIISDIFVLPSSTESFGLVALEAMACATPVISTNSGGISEVNIDGKTGFLSDVGDVSKMANDTVKLLEDKNLLDKFKHNALVHSKSYSLHNILPQYNRIYKELCQLKKNK